MLTHGSVDFWRHIWFIRDGDCLRFVGFVDGYQIALAPSRHHGVRDIRAHTYPLRGVTETHRYDGSAFKRAPH